jgi:hypothetical protein
MGFVESRVTSMVESTPSAAAEIATIASAVAASAMASVARRWRDRARGARLSRSANAFSSSRLAAIAELSETVLAAP